MIWDFLPQELLAHKDMMDEKSTDEGILDEAIDGEKEENDLPVIEGVEWQSALSHLPDKDLLMETIYDFYSTMNGEADFLQNCYDNLESDDGMMDSYRIKVHAMKSSAALIGITGLSEKAKALEMAAKEGDKEYILKNTEEFLTQWRSYKEKLSVCIQEDEKETLSDFSILDEKLENLKEAMDFMDIDMADEIMKEIRSYEYSDEISDKIESLGVSVVNLDVDAVNELIDEIRNNWENKK